MALHKKIKSKKFMTGLILVLLIVSLAWYYGFFSPSKPAVLLKLSSNGTEIFGFVKAKHALPMACIACVGYDGHVKVYYNGTLICEARDSTISLGDIYLPILCNQDLFNYEGKDVMVSAVGAVTPAGSQTITSYDNKTLNLSFINK